MPLRNTSTVQVTTTRLYVIALTLVALLSTTAYLTIRKVIAEHKFHAEVINVSGRQRMLSQRIAFFAAELIYAKKSDRSVILSEFDSMVDLFEKSHRDLSLGSPELGAPTPEVRNIYFGPQGLDKDATELIAYSRSFMRESNEQGDEAKKAFEAIQNISRNVILPKLDSVVKLNQQESERQVSKLHGIETIVLTLTLILLFLEALFIFRPMTKRIAKLFQAAIDAREKAIQATDAKSAFLATVTHEIRTPLAGVSGIINGLLESNSRHDEPLKHKLNLLDRLVKSLLTLVNDILDYSKIEAGKLLIENIDFSIDAVAEDSQALFFLTAKAKGVQLDINQDPSLPKWLNGDPTRLRQVVANLINNAIKFTPQGGTVTARFLKRDVNNTHVHLRFEIQDTGCGIPLDVQDSMFHNYTQSDASVSRTHGGTGLGLAICKQIIELMGGEIGFESAVGKGSTFWFDVPLKLAEIHEDLIVKKKTSTKGLEIYSGIRILLVEDNDELRDVTSETLVNLGFTVRAVSNGKDAIKMMDEDPFDIVLMDCEMPILDGFETTKIIREKESQRGASKTPILALTGHSSDNIRILCQRAGMNDLITKPILARSLSQVLNPWLRRKNTDAQELSSKTRH